MDIARIVVGAPASSSGKTTVVSGLLAAYTAAGRRAVGFKVGPDYIDPSYHSLACGRPSRNLDPVLVGEQQIAPLFAHGAVGADVAVVEGVMGLFDGRAHTAGLGSTAQVAELLDAPVLLVVDARAQGRSIAALVHGFRSFGGAVRVAGVILNQVGSDLHRSILRDALDEIGVPLLGVLPRHVAVATPSRHLGLVPVAERRQAAREAIKALASMIAENVDLDAVLRIARTAPPVTAPQWSPAPPFQPWATRSSPPPVVAVAEGPAFSFRYAETTEMVEAAGADVRTFDPVRDEHLPEGTRALLVGGGFPEVYATELAANEPLRAQVAALAAAGAPVAAECAGLLWLCRSLDGQPMCGVLPSDAVMTDRLRLGYRDATTLSDSWFGPAGTRFTGHEFHRTRVVPEQGDRPAWSWSGSTTEGFVVANVHASYLHLHWAGSPGVAARLVAACA